MAFFAMKEFNTKQQLIDALQNLSTADLTQQGLSEAQAGAILGHSQKPLPMKQKATARTFPRLASKYLTLEIVGYACVLQEAVDLGYLFRNFRQLLIQNFKLIKATFKQAEKKVIRSVFQLLDERWLSKRYRLQYFGGIDSDKDVEDCCRLLGSRLNFYSIQIWSSQMFMLSKFRPIKVTVFDCVDIPLLYKHLPSSVTSLKIYGEDDEFVQSDYPAPRVFKELSVASLSNYEDIMIILRKYATATESLTIEWICLEVPGVIDYLMEMNCKQIIVETDDLSNEKLIEFFNCQSKAKKLIQFEGGIATSQVEQEQWGIQQFTSKSLEQELVVHIEGGIGNNEQLFQRLFKGSLSIFKKKRAQIDEYIQFDSNVCLPNADTLTESIWTSNVPFGVFALNNCKGLNRFQFFLHGDCNYQQLAVEKLFLQEIIISYARDLYVPLISDILKKSKDTLRLLKYDGEIDLSPLRNSKVLRQLYIEGDISDANLEVIGTFQNLQDLASEDMRILELLQNFKSLKKFKIKGELGENIIEALPQTIQTLDIQYFKSLEMIKLLLQHNPILNEITSKIISKEDIAYLLYEFKNIKFNINLNATMNLLTFNQAYVILHPEIGLPPLPASEPDHAVYDLLFQRLTNKFALFWPYIQQIGPNDKFEAQYLANCSPKMIDKISTFKEFQHCLINIANNKIKTFSHFDQVFNNQISMSTNQDYLHIIVSAYDEVFQLGANIDKAVAKLKGMTADQRKKIKRQSFFNHCRSNWMSPLTSQDFNDASSKQSIK
ncbi:hypothetical protein FGO68_gene812 [Halteria grandinella]|uniref:Uncharacterized protein n=1 Tax=Halteria grandinella TaxID=5974 RepID=A0A8J8P120_HALGN|nr:hypothetical protein FGO68_gene812 [Halteria grandinella]